MKTLGIVILILLSIAPAFCHSRVLVAAQAITYKTRPDSSLQFRYAEKIKRADSLFEANNYPLAEKEYNKALLIKPAEEYPVSRLIQIYASRCPAVKPRSDSLPGNMECHFGKTEAYLKTIVMADSLFRNKAYDQAKEKYAQALAIKPGESYPAEKIKELNSIAYCSPSYSLCIEEGDRALKAKEYEQAQVMYRKALALNQNELYARNKLKEIENRNTTQQNMRGLETDKVSRLRIADSLYRKTTKYAYIKYNPSKKLFFLSNFDSTWKPFNPQEISRDCEIRKTNASALISLMEEMQKNNYLYVGGGGVVDCDDCSTKIVLKRRGFRCKYVSFLVIADSARKKSCSSYIPEGDFDPGDCVDGSRKHLTRLTNEIYRLVENELKGPE